MTDYDFAEMRQRWQNVAQAMQEDMLALQREGWPTSARMLAEAYNRLSVFDDFAAGFPGQDREQKK